MGALSSKRFVIQPRLALEQAPDSFAKVTRWQRKASACAARAVTDLKPEMGSFTVAG